ncbi:MAG TPA: hypothetical protein DEG96_05210 [Candidatus Atribacteria bacterium]|nr:hypothetical protein [Candidatus Atribacteria bacterium]
MRKIDRGKTKKIFLFLGICIFLLLVFSNSMLAAEKQPILRVGIFLNQDEVNISGDGPFKIYNLKTKGLISEEKNKIIKILPHKKGIEVLGIGVYSGLLNIVPVGDTKIIVIIKGQKYRYRGNIEVVINKDYKKLDVINVIGIEEYLYGVMKKEISPRWPIEVLKAQAIAARTFAIFNMNKYIDKGYNICASTNSQAYGGVNHEDPLTNRAVDETRGLIMVYKGEPINAVYHSDSGGYTEDSENVWGEYVPYLRSVESKYEEIVSPPHHNWIYSITKEELVDKLNKQGYKINSVLSIEPVEKTKTGRVSKLAFISESNEVIHIKANDFRKLIGPDLIRSTLFKINPTREESNDLKNVENKEVIKEKQIQKESIKEILEQKKEWTINELIELMKKRREEEKKEKEQEKEQEITTVETVKTLYVPLSFLFSGSGNGHGVGMSQWGAYGMALQGYKYQDILKYYYQGINIIKKY